MSYQDLNYALFSYIDTVAADTVESINQFYTYIARPTFDVIFLDKSS